MDTAAYEKVVIADTYLPVMILENNKVCNGYRQPICPLHWHEHLELHYLFEGSLNLRIGQAEHALNAGDLAVINSNEIHSSWFAGRLKERILIFRPEDLSVGLSGIADGFQPVIRQDSFVRERMEQFESEYTQMLPGSSIACKGILLQLMVYLSRKHPMSAASTATKNRHSQQLQRLLPVQEYITLHFTQEISSETLADMVYLSKDRFNHLFKETMGVPLRKYINEIRLHTAYSWLEQGLYSPAEAAAKVGFTDYNHFGRLFRQTFGCTPSQVLHP